MDKRRTINGIALTLLAVGAWLLLQWYINKNYPLPPAGQPVATNPTPIPPPATSPAAVPTTNPAATGPSATGPSSTTAPVIAPAPRAPDAPGVMPPDLTKAVPVTLGDAAPNAAEYAMQVRVSMIGAGIDGITLNDFRRSEDFKLPLKERRPYVYQEAYAGADLGYTRPMATRSVTVNGATVDLSTAQWELQGPPTAVTRQVTLPKQPAPTTLTGQAVTYAVIVGLPDAAGVRQPVLKVSKTYTVFKRSDPTKGFEVWVDNAYENVSESIPTLTVTSQINGPTLPPRETNSSQDRSVLAGFLNGKGDGLTVKQFHEGDFKDAEPTINLHEKGPDPDKYGKPTMTWAGAAGLYFNAFVQPADPKTLAGVSAEQKRGPEYKTPEDRPAVTLFQTAPATIGPKGSPAAAVDLRAFFGPRWRDVVDTPYYGDLPRDYDQTLVVKSGPCGWCAWDWLINGMVGLLKGLHWVAGGFVDRGDWGIAIILLVAIVRSLLHPITKRSQVQMMKMGEMGPAMAKLKEKYGDDKEGFSRAQMELMKAQGFAPILGCLPMFLQMPIWIALYQGLQSTFELRQAPFLWGWTWIQDLSKPDYIIKFSHDVQLIFGLHLDGINLLPILLGIVFHLQARIQNSLSVASTPEQEQQKKMMMWMSTFLFPLFLYNGPSGLNLYILTSTIVGMIESKIVRDHIKQRKEAEKAAGVVVVDAPAVPAKAAAGTGRKATVRRAAEPAEDPTKQGGLRGMIARMQARVEELQREQEKKAKKK